MFMLMQDLGNSSMRSNHGHDVVLLLTILVQYRKYEVINLSVNTECFALQLVRTRDYRRK